MLNSVLSPWRVIQISAIHQLHIHLSALKWVKMIIYPVILLNVLNSWTFTDSGSDSSQLFVTNHLTSFLFLNWVIPGGRWLLCSSKQCISIAGKAVPTQCHPHMTPCSMHYQLLFKDCENIPDLGWQRPKTQRSKHETSAERTNWFTRICTLLSNSNNHGGLGDILFIVLYKYDTNTDRDIIFTRLACDYEIKAAIISYTK